MTRTRAPMTTDANAMLTRTTKPSWEVGHAGAGTALVLTYLGLIPGVSATLLLTAAFAAAVLLPALVLAAAAAVVIGPPYGIWRLATHNRGRRKEQGARRRAALRSPSSA
jgi:hypothetical protein